MDNCHVTSKVVSAVTFISDDQFFTVPVNVDSTKSKGTVRWPRPHSSVTCTDFTWILKVSSFFEHSVFWKHSVTSPADSTPKNQLLQLVVVLVSQMFLYSTTFCLLSSSLGFGFKTAMMVNTVLRIIGEIWEKSKTWLLFFF